ncbi:MAG: response regulator [Gelidibacter sp.]|uniref:response regulator n=1 Tax=Gelidibacter sp. TaxID=2018083 RepID=UPI0032677A5E
MKLKIDKVELEQVLSNALNIISFGVTTKNLEMLLDMDPHIPKNIWIDVMRLEQILINLLENALKFTEKGEIKLSVQVLDDYGNDKMLLRFAVKDTGIGINEDQLQEILNSFTQEAGNITNKYGGTDLDLTISNKLLALVNSELRLESKLGHGSNFFFDLKVKTENEEIDHSLKDIKKVLIVDGNTNNRRILKRMLEIKNIEIEEADSGLQALITIMDNPGFEVIIMDYHMPIMDGIETIKKIKELQATQETKPAFVVLYSSSDDEHLQKACDELEIKARLVKPIRMSQMYQALEDLQYTTSDEIDDVIIEEKEDMDFNMTIMIAEDNPINMTLTKIFVNQVLPKARIIEAVDGEEAVEHYKKEQPDLIIMDIQMPKINGIEATRKIRILEKHIEIPIIALTAGSLPGQKEKCLAAGMSDYLTKPILQFTLAEMLRKWLGSKMGLMS